MPTRKVLVVDDEPVITGLIAEILKQEGYQVTICNDATEGLAVAQSGDQDLILLDISMPTIDGYEFCRRLKKDGLMDKTPVIFLSGKSAEEDAGRSFELGAATYIRKPFSNTSLREIVNLTMSALGR